MIEIDMASLSNHLGMSLDESITNSLRTHHQTTDTRLADERVDLSADKRALCLVLVVSWLCVTITIVLACLLAVI